MNMSKSRDIQAKMPSPKVIFYAFWLVTVKVLNSYKTPKITGQISGKTGGQNNEIFHRHRESRRHQKSK